MSLKQELRQQTLDQLGLSVLMPLLDNNCTIGSRRHILRAYLANGRNITNLKRAAVVWQRVIDQLFQVNTEIQVLHGIERLLLSTPLTILLHDCGASGWENFVEKYQRANELYDALTRAKLVMRSDSILIREYIEDGSRDIDSIVHTMTEMKFLYQHDKCLGYTHNMELEMEEEISELKSYGWIPEEEWRETIQQLRIDVSKRVKNDIWKSIANGTLHLPQPIRVPPSVQAKINRFKCENALPQIFWHSAKN